jgi:hypothetical protein
MRNRSHKLFLREAIFESLTEMEFDLLDPIQRNQACDRDQTLVALREWWTLPHVAEK